MEPIVYTPIGVVRSPHAGPEGTPIQPPGGSGIDARVEIRPEYAEGLRDLDGFSHLILLYHCHLAKPGPLTVKPFLEDAEHGLFATRAPARPNPIGLSVVRLKAVEGTTLHISDVDIIDGAPILDVKPYVPAFDAPDPGGVRTGWLETRVHRTRDSRDDGRFSR